MRLLLEKPVLEHNPSTSLMRHHHSLCSARVSTALLLTPLRWCRTTPVATSVKSTPQKLQGLTVADSDGFGGFRSEGGSFDGFINLKKKQINEAKGEGQLPCDVPGSDAAAQSEAALLEEIAKTGKLPSPKRDPPPVTATKPSSAMSSPTEQTPSAGACASIGGGSGLSSSSQSTKPAPITRSSLPRPLPKGAPATTRKPLVAPRDSAPLPAYTGAEDAADYYKDLPRNQLSKEEMWTRIQDRARQETEQFGTAVNVTEAEYLKMEEELKEHDLFHFRLGELAFPDETKRRDYWSMWQLATSLNKARWTMLEIHAQRGVKTTGAGMKMLFWKESLYEIAEKGDMPMGQFVDSHPVLRPFAAAVKRTPGITKTFIRGFADTRLKVLQQPGNVKQLFDHFDKFYGYYFNTMLEILGCKDDHAEHIMCHIGRAIGLTQHCVMFWKQYAKIGFTMLPSDLCANNHVNLTLLRNLSLASRDRAVRHLLCDVMAIVKEEMMHAQTIAKHCPPKMWPLLCEAFYPNYYLGFLQKHEFNVSALLADHNIENPGFVWYRLKKRWEWERHQDLTRLVAEDAPLPYINTSYGHRASKYRQLKEGETKTSCDHGAHS